MYGIVYLDVTSSCLFCVVVRGELFNNECICYLSGYGETVFIFGEHSVFEFGLLSDVSNNKLHVLCVLPFVMSCLSAYRMVLVSVVFAECVLLSYCY